MARYATIVGTGHYLPEIEVSNDEYRRRFDAKLPDVINKFEASSGIRTRFYAPESWATSDLAARAGEAALKAAGIRPEQVDMVLVGTDSPDYLTPATSVVTQHKLGAKNAGTFDIGCACASFPTGLAIGAGLIAANPWCRYVLVIGAYMMHKLADPNDIVSFFYGDGAGAAVLAPADKPGFISSAFLADGSFYDYWGIFAGGTAEPATEENVKAGRTQVRQVKRYPPEVNHEGWPKLARMVAERGEFDLNDVDMAIFTQVRLPSIHLVMDALGLPISKAHWIMDRWGYTGSACVPMCLDDAIHQGRVKPGQLVLMVGSGVGYNQAGVAFRMP